MRITATLFSLMLVVAACSSSESDSAPTSAPPATEAEVATTVAVTTTTAPVEAVTTTAAEPGPTRSDTFTTLFPTAPEGVAFYEPPAELPGITGDVIWAEELEERDGGRVFRMLYRSQTTSGVPSAVSGWVLVPSSSPPDGGFPVIGWAPEATGLDDECAASRTGVPELAIPSVDSLLERGFVVASTDYEGLGTPGDHPFGVAASEGQALLDAVRAAQQFIGGGNEVFLAGAGQGGHAAIAAAEQASRYAPELPLTGVIAAATPVFAADSELVAGRAGTTSQGLIVLHAVGQQVAFGAAESPVTRWLTEGGAGLAELGQGLCLGAYLPAFEALDAAALFIEGAPAPFTSGAARTAAISIGSQPTSAPTLLFHGRDDVLTPAAVIPGWVDAACAAGQSIELVWLDAGSRPLADAGAEIEARLFRWLDDRLAGATAASDCGEVPQPTD